MEVPLADLPRWASGRAGRDPAIARGRLARAALRRGLPLAASRPHIPAMPILPIPSAAAEREYDEARWNPERETLELATVGAAQVLGPDHGVTKALARVSVPHRKTSKN